MRWNDRGAQMSTSSAVPTTPAITVGDAEVAGPARGPICLEFRPSGSSPPSVTAEGLRDVLLSAFARISRDTARFEGMRQFDPGLWRIDIRPEVVPVPAVVLTLVVDGRPVQGFGISGDVNDAATTAEIASNFQDFDEWLQWPLLPDGRHLTPRRSDGKAEPTIRLPMPSRSVGVYRIRLQTCRC